MSAVGFPTFDYVSYLPSRLQVTLSGFDQKFRSHIETVLIPFPDGPEITNEILEIASFCKGARTDDTIPRFFQEVIINTPCGLDALKKLHEVCKKGGGTLFFDCVSTNKIDYYKTADLIKIIDKFSAICSAIPSFPSNAHFPSYDAGGKELLRRIERKPDQIQALLSYGEMQSVSSARRHVPKLEEKVFTDFISFQDVVSSMTQYLASLPPNDRLGMEVYSKFFKDLKRANLSDRNKARILKIAILTTSRKDPSFSISDDYVDLSHLLEASCGLLQEGDEEFALFCSSLKISERYPLKTVKNIINSLKIACQDFDNYVFVHQVLSKFASREIDLKQLATQLKADGTSTPQLPLDIDDFIGRLSGAERDPSVAFPIKQSVLRQITADYKKVYDLIQKWKELSLPELVAETKRVREHPSRDSDLELVALGYLAILKKFSKSLYESQVLSVLGLLRYDTNVFAQVKTGEGKSLIVGLLGFILASKNQSVHIVSFGKSLAKRDQKAFFDFYREFGIATNHICENSPKKDRFQGSIIYGTASDFEHSVLREMVLFQEQFPQKLQLNSTSPRFDCVIIDEADNLAIDTVQNAAIIGYPAEESDDWVYVPIFQLVKRFGKDNPPSASALRSFLAKDFLNGKYSEKVKRLSDDQLKKWIDSAHRGIFTKQEGEEYIIEKKAGSPVRKVKIVDQNNTGQVHHQSRWQDGLHEFIELKHGIDFCRESVTPAQLSHPVFYQMYRRIYGLSGTLGAAMDRKGMEDIYGIQTLDVPTHCRSQRVDLPSIIAVSVDDYIHRIIGIIEQKIREGRPILVLCESINDTKRIGIELERRHIKHEVYNETQEKDEETIIEGAGLPGAVTIATNVAGRGTDIRLDQKSLDKGGLHALLTFFPRSLRVEQQARGRAGRQGEPGSSEIIVCREKLRLDPAFASDEDVWVHLESARNNQIATTYFYNTCQAKLERHSFSLVCKFYAALNLFKEKSSDSALNQRLIYMLSARKLLKPPTQPSDLKEADREMGHHAMELFSSPNVQPTHWDSYLSQVKRRLIERSIRNWALEFNHKITTLIHEINGLYVVLANLAVRGIEIPVDLFANLERRMNKFSEIDQIYESCKKDSQKYLDSTLNGVIQYIRDVSGAKLVNMSMS